MIYEERTIVLRQVPASVCPECGDAMLTEETTIVIKDMLRRKAGRSKTDLVYEA